MHHKLFIDGEWVPGSAHKTFRSLNPATEESIGSFEEGNEKDVKRAVDAAERAFEKWSEGYYWRAFGKT